MLTDAPARDRVPAPRDLVTAVPGGTVPPRGAPVLLFGAHGGCGVTTLAAHTGAHTAVREAQLVTAVVAPSEELTCVVVAAATADGTARAVRALHQLELAGHLDQQLRLVLIRDGRGPLPVAARARMRLLSAVVGGIDVLPHVQRWRYESGTPKTRSRRYDRAVEEFAGRLLGSREGVRVQPVDDVRFFDDDPDDLLPSAGALVTTSSTLREARS